MPKRKLYARVGFHSETGWVLHECYSKEEFFAVVEKIMKNKGTKNERK